MTILNCVKRVVVIAENYSGPDKILYIFEDTCGSGKPPRALEINPPQFPLSINIYPFSSLDRFFHVFLSELSTLTTINYPKYCLVAKLIATIQEINKESTEVEEKILEKYREAFLGFFTNLDKIPRISIKLEKISSKILDYDFTNLIYKLANREHSNIEYMPYIAETLNDIVDEIR